MSEIVGEARIDEIVSGMRIDECANCVAFDVAVLDDQIVAGDEKVVQQIEHT